MSNNTDNENGSADASRARRGSINASALTALFGRPSNTAAPTAPFPAPNAAAPQEQRRRMSISTLGLSGTSPTQNSPFGFGGRRASISTERSDSIDESAIDDDDGPGRSNPTTPYTRRMSFGTGPLRSRNVNGGSPGTSGRAPSYVTSGSSSLPTIPAGSSEENDPPNSQASTQSKPRTTSDFPSARPGEGGFNWSEQLRSRAESSVSQNQRPSFSFPNATRPVQGNERNKSIGEMPTPPSQVPAPAPARPERQKPDHFQERILKGDFYMD